MNLCIFVKRIFFLIYLKGTHDKLCFLNNGGAKETVFPENEKNEN